MFKINHPGLRISLLIAVLLLTGACTLPAPATPTPFTFPTPNQTLTALYAPTSTATEPPPTLPPLEATDTSTPLPSSTIDATAGTVAPTATLASSGLDARPNGSPISAVRAAAAPVIDANLSDWPNLSNSARINNWGAEFWSGASDLSAVYDLGWDDNNLYLAVDVTDDTHAQVSSGINLWKGDEVEIMLDVNLADDYYSGVLDGDDYQIGFSPGNFNGLKESYYRWRPLSYGGYPAGIIVAAKQTSSGYILEVKIPWSAFGLNDVSVGSRFGFSLGISDNDVAGTSRQQSMVTIVSGYRLVNPTTWGTLILADATGK